MSASAALPKLSDNGQPISSFRQRNWLGALLIIVLVFVAYARVFNAGFVWDDESHLTQNPCVIGPLGLKEIWTSARAVYYPLVLTTFWALHKVVGLTPWSYHLLNVLLHAGSAVLLWQVLRQLNVRGAWLGATLWALHPVMVQSVAWVTELKNTQSCVFYLLSIFCFLRFGLPAPGRFWNRNSMLVQLALSGRRPCRNALSSRGARYGFTWRNWSGRIRSYSSIHGGRLNRRGSQPICRCLRH